MERGIDVFKLPAGSSVFNNTWQLIKLINVSHALLYDTSFATSNKMLANSSRNRLMFV